MSIRYDRTRLHAILALRGMTFEALSRRLQISTIHLRHVVGGTRRPSQRLASALAAELGRAAAFACCQTDILDAREIRVGTASRARKSR